MTIENTDLLKDFFTIDQPLGRVEAVEHINNGDQQLFKSYFNPENYLFRLLAKSNPTMIVGRRGSGKTDALLSYQFHENLSKEFGPVVYFEAGDAGSVFSNVLFQINEQIKYDSPQPLVEKVSDLWTYLFWTSVFSSLVIDENTNESVRLVLTEFLSDHGIDASETNPYNTTYKCLIALIKHYSSLDETVKSLGFFNSFEQWKLSGISYRDAKTAAIEQLKTIKQDGIILFDSFEELDVTNDQARLTISGLLRCVSRFHSPTIPIQMRCCIPAEAYFYVLDLSSNVLKDFQKQIVLHWSSMEILSLCATRFASFIQLYSPDKHDELVKAYDLNDRKGVAEFWMKHLPTQVLNSNPKYPENTIAYLMRHTQLLPRQMIMLLNTCIHAHLSSGGAIGEQIAPEIITSNVRKIEYLIANQIINAYEFIWPDAIQQAEMVLKRIGSNTISWEQMRIVFNRSNVKGYGNVYEFSDLLRLLTNLGVIGRKLKETPEYIIALFEYSEPHKLQFSPDDIFCIHPCFSGAMQVHNEGDFPEDFKPIYPLGSDLTGDDRRIIFE